MTYILTELDDGKLCVWLLPYILFIIIIIICLCLVSLWMNGVAPVIS